MLSSVRSIFTIAKRLYGWYSLCFLSFIETERFRFFSTFHIYLVSDWRIHWIILNNCTIQPQLTMDLLTRNWNFPNNNFQTISNNNFELFKLIELSANTLILNTHCARNSNRTSVSVDSYCSNASCSLCRVCF